MALLTGAPIYPVALEGALDPEIAGSMGAMAAALRHRGPDGDGSHVSESAALAHQRLAIIDRAGGDQPMSNEDGSCWVVFNGEIYNHHELRRELEARGHVFTSHCDFLCDLLAECGSDIVAWANGDRARARQ